MKFETTSERLARSQYNKLFGRTRHDFSERERYFYRECALLQATLKGFSVAVKQRYKQIHARGLTVDHIVPLWGVDSQGNHIVSGLNVPWNLRGETKQNNLKKGNYFVDNKNSIGIILHHKAAH